MGSSQKFAHCLFKQISLISFPTHYGGSEKEEVCLHLLYPLVWLERGLGRVQGVGQEGLGNPSFSCSLNQSEAASFLKEHNYIHIDYCIIISPSLISLVGWEPEYH